MVLSDGKIVGNSRDMIGITVKVSEVITTNGGSIRYSGINWQARLYQASSSTIAIDEMVTIRGVNGTVMLVE